MYRRILNFLLLTTFLCGYIEWGGGHKSFIFQAEIEFYHKAMIDPISLFHPLILIPFAGQLIILFTLFQKQPGRVLSKVALVCLSSLMLFLTFIGIISLNMKILGSTIPFIIVALLVVRNNRRVITSVGF